MTVLRRIFPDVLTRESLRGRTNTAQVLILSRKLLGVLGQEALLIFFGDCVLALLFRLWRFEHLGGTDIITYWSFWLLGGFGRVNSRLVLQTSRRIFPNVLTGELVASQIRSLDLVGQGLWLLAFLFVFWE